MRSFMAQHSFLLLALLLLAITAAVTARIKRRWLRAAIPGGLAMALLVTFLFLRTGAGNIDTVADFDRALAGGRPVMLELYSDY